MTQSTISQYLTVATDQETLQVKKSCERKFLQANSNKIHNILFLH